MALDRLDTNGKSSGPTPLPGSDEAGMPREVYALLAQANLLRMRGCWGRAVDNCMAALQVVPDSPSAQSLLGDIYENQGRFDDAVQWYRMALDANPDSPADRLKLDRLHQRQQALIRAERRAAAPSLTEEDRVPLGEEAPPRRLMQDPETALRYGAVAATVLVFLVVVLAYASVHRRTALASLGLVPYQEVKTAPVVVTPVDHSEAGGPPRDLSEQAALDSLSSSRDLSAENITVDDVQFDPRVGRMTISLGLVPGALTQAAALRRALHAAEAASAANPSVNLFTIRCRLLPSAGSGSSLIFVGDTSRSALPGSGMAELDEEQVQATFLNVWWSSRMPS